MSRIDRSSLIARPAAVVFDLVNEVAAYPDAFNWCRGASVLERDAGSMLAKLDLSFAGFQSSFATRNRFIRPERIDLELVEGPFALRGAWTFTALGERGCRVNLHLDFEMAGRFVGSALAIGFQGLADRMVDDFARVARQLPEQGDAD